jgi:hypothetical protein
MAQIGIVGFTSDIIVAQIKASKVITLQGLTNDRGIAMAKVVGTSQAWGLIRETLDRHNLTVNQIKDLRELLNQKRLDYEKAKEEATKSFEYELEQAICSLEEIQRSSLSILESGRKEYEFKIELIDITIQDLKEERWIIRKIINGFKIRDYRTQLEKLKAERHKYFHSIKTNISKKQQDVEYRKSNRDTLIEDRCQNIRFDITHIEQVLASHEFAGAIAELELIELLRKLPENFYIINDVRIRLDSGIQFDGEWLESAQIDHLVISPAGLFVIEAKSWSKEFVGNGNYFDPYQQVKRSSYLCYKLLEDKLQSAKVRSIIAYKGAVPNKANDSFAKVLQFREVNGYILWFKEKKLSDEQIKDLAEYLM